MDKIEIDIIREEALRRFALIAPLLEDGISAFEKTRRKLLLLENNETSERTLRRWCKAYREQGFEGLLRRERSDKGKCKSIAPEVLELAAECRRELPRRSAGLIQDYLATQGHKVARSTLERHLRIGGLSGRQLRVENRQTLHGSRRFVRKGRNTLWQTDIKYGPYLPDPKNPGKKIRTYLLVIIDDATRSVVGAEFYEHQRQPLLEDALKKAIQRNGSPRNIYVDNGKIFVSDWMRLACATLNIRHMRTAPYSPEAKGKVERFNRTVEEFFAEVQLQKPQTVDELNSYFRTWLSERYQHKPHSALSGKTPAEAFAEDTTPLRFHSQEVLRQAFLHEETRQVDKSGCFKLSGKVYDCGVELLRKRVLVRFDPFHLEEVEVWHQGKYVKNAHLANIGESNATQRVPCEKIEEAAGSRVLDAYKQGEQKRFKKRHGVYRVGAGA